MTPSSFRWPLAALLYTTVAFIMLTDQLVLAAPGRPGVNVALVLLLAAAVVTLRFPMVLAMTAGRLALGVALLMAVAQTLEAGVLAPLLGVVALLVLIGLARSGGAREVASLLLELPLQVVLLGVRPCLDAVLCRRWRRSHAARAGHGTGLLRAWWLPLALGAGFAGLFALANPVVAGWGDALGAWLRHWPLPDPVRCAAWWMFGLGMWLLLRARWARPQRRAERVPVDRSALAVRALLVFNALFAVQNLLDLSYLTGGVALPTGMTYAAYAHRGAYPLMATALLAAAFVLAWFAPGAPAQEQPWARRLVLAWLAQNVVLLGAAAWRLHLYVDVYGLSLWRVAALIWFGLVGSGLLLIAWRIHARLANRWLVRANVLVATAVLSACALVDWGGLIAWHNVRHGGDAGGEGVAVDVGYLASLGPPARPALRWLAGHAGRAEVAERAAKVVQELDEELRQRRSDWRGWTVRSARWEKER